MRRILSTAAVLAAMSLTTFPVRAAPPVEVRTIDGGYSRIAVHPDGQLYGFRQGPDYTNAIVNRGWEQSVRVEKRSAAGALVWSADNLGNWPDDLIFQVPVDIAIDAAGNAVTVQHETCWAAFHTDGSLMRYDAATGAQTLGQPAWQDGYAITPPVLWNTPVWLYFGRYETPAAVAADASGRILAPLYVATGGWGDPIVYSTLLVRYDPAVGQSSALVPTEVVPDASAVMWASAGSAPLGVAAFPDGSAAVAGPAGTVKFDAALAQAWVVPVPGVAAATDAQGDLYVTGPAGTAKLSGVDGAVLWTEPTAGQALALDPGGSLLVTGAAETVLLSASGARQWAVAVGGNDVGADAAGNTYVLAAGTVHVLAPDRDGDGYPVGVDCNDADASIYPGAREVVRDGIDQDCNGYDLTILVSKAAWNAKSTMLSVEASSLRGAAAQLQVAGFGAMKWEPLAQRWSLNVKVAAKPAVVTVSGPEGSVAAAVR